MAKSYMECCNNSKPEAPAPCGCNAEHVEFVKTQRRTVGRTVVWERVYRCDKCGVYCSR